jgi:hypothetical protein
VNEPIADGIGDGSVGDQLMPVVSRQLAGDKGGTQVGVRPMICFIACWIATII